MKRLADSHNPWEDTSFLLGVWSGVYKDGKFSKGKSYLAMVFAKIKFAANTGRRSVEKDIEEERQRGSESDDGDESEGEEEN